MGPHFSFIIKNIKRCILFCMYKIDCFFPCQKSVASTFIPTRSIFLNIFGLIALKLQKKNILFWGVGRQTSRFTRSAMANHRLSRITEVFHGFIARFSRLTIIQGQPWLSTVNLSRCAQILSRFTQNYHGLPRVYQKSVIVHGSSKLRCSFGCCLLCFAWKSNESRCGIPWDRHCSRVGCWSS